MNVRTGFIGYGSMGSMIVQGLLDKKCLQPDNVLISTRHPTVLTGLLDKYPSVHVAQSNRALARECNRVMLCTKPLDAVQVLSEISHDLKPDTHLVSIAACLPIEQISRFYTGPITRVVPSLTGEMSSGVTLLCITPQSPGKRHRNAKSFFPHSGT